MDSIATLVFAIGIITTKTLKSQRAELKIANQNPMNSSWFNNCVIIFLSRFVEIFDVVNLGKIPKLLNSIVISSLLSSES